MLQTMWSRWYWGDNMLPVCDDWDNVEEQQDVEQWEKVLLTLIVPPHNDDDGLDKDQSPVAHVQQTEAWDCGIACLLMAIAWLRNNQAEPPEVEDNNDHDDTLKSWMLKTTDTESIWSMDLVYLLEEYRKRDSSCTTKFTYLFCTKALQVDEQHKDLHFYQKAFETDQARVTQLFARAEQEQWNLMHWNNLSMTHLLHLVGRPDCLAIALVDNAILMQRGGDAAYAGHYIVISGVVDGMRMRIHNPASKEPVELIAISLFERAWKAKGTDNDILFLVKR